MILGTDLVEKLEQERINTPITDNAQIEVTPEVHFDT